MKARRLWFLVPLLPACGSVSDDWTDVTGSVDQAIKGGEPDPDDPAVVGIANEYGICTGTLIARNLVLTAQHCVAPTPTAVVCGEAGFGKRYPIRSYVVTTKDKISFTDGHGVVKVWTPDEAKDVCGGDIALLVLADNVKPSEAWYMPPRVDLDVEPGEEYRAVGFGATDMGGTQPGTRRQRGELKVRCLASDCEAEFQVQEREWMGEEGVCPGDSGGPALDTTGRVIGITSRGGDDCTTPIYTSVKRWGDWIKEMAANAAELGGYGPEPWVTGGSTEPTPAPPDPPDEPDAGAAGEDGGAVFALPGLQPPKDNGCSMSPSRPASRPPWMIASLAALRLVRRTCSRGRAASPSKQPTRTNPTPV